MFDLASGYNKCSNSTSCNISLYVFIPTMTHLTLLCFIFLSSPKILTFVFGSDVPVDCLKDGTCEKEQGNHEKEKYRAKGKDWLLNFDEIKGLSKLENT